MWSLCCVMKTTDYSKIAKRYDGNRLRKDFSVCSDLINYVSRSRAKRFRVLDLGCGTGNFIKVHSSLNDLRSVSWHGLDSSEEMLNIAKSKKLARSCVFELGTAEKLPYNDRYFDIIICNFAFHHFRSKRKVISEIYRCLRGNGIFIMKDIEPYSMKDWWVYKFFPSTFQVDKSRFWGLTKIINEFKNMSFTPEIRIEKKIFYDDLNLILKDSLNRDISELTLIPLTEYKSGVREIRKQLKNTPIFLTENSIMNLITQKQTGD